MHFRHANRGPLSAALFLAALGAVQGCAAPEDGAGADPAQGSAAPGGVATLVLRGGRIVTLDEERPEVTALAARGGRILAIGSEAEIAAHVGPETRVLDLEGRLAIPGFIEGHGHFLSIGDAKLQLDLMGAASWEAIVAQVAGAVAAAQPGELIRGRGWHQEKWNPAPEPTVEGLPTHHALSAVSPENPVLLRHASGHATFANARAMELAGIDRSTPDPPGGEIVRDAEGEPIGVFRETASGLLAGVSGAATPTDPRRLAELADREVLSKGITSFQDAGSSFEDVELFRALAEEGRLGVRLWVMLRESNERLAQRLPGFELVGAAGDRLTCRAIKRSLDGALGSHGAWLLEPYTDLPTSTGLNTISVESLHETARLALEHDLQLCVHAIGDRANRETLDVFEDAYRRGGGSADLRWRVEHAQHLHPDEVPRFAELGVIASMQGVHCTSDGPWVPDRLGDARAEEGAYVWRKLIDAGVLISNGTDAPVEDVDPIASFYSSVSRRMAHGKQFYPEQRMTRLEALRSYTWNCAYAAFEEDLKGSLTPGKLADVTVLSRDILSVPEDEIPGARVDYTIVGGEVLYARDGG